MNKIDYYRKVIIYGISEEELSTLKEFDGWEYKEKEINLKGVYKFQNTTVGKGVEITLNKEVENVYISVNVLPLDEKYFKSDVYIEGFDSSENQATSITDDVLYSFCLCFNKMARVLNKDTNNYWVCGIIPAKLDK